jgi:LmbE family N-acetylglucosaminyl deacetylase
MVSKFNLLVVAHPDDETIYFSGLLQNHRRLPWSVICVTDGNADGNGSVRREQFAHAMKLQRIQRFEMWDFPDIFERRLDVSALTARLKLLRPNEVFTHGVLGEYGHPHHQDVCMATHLAYRKVYSIAHNCYPDKTVRLTAAQYTLKAKILSNVYQSETRRFIQFLPATAWEGFAHFSRAEVELVYEWLAFKKKPQKALPKKLRWYLPYLEEMVNESAKRPF